MPWTAIGAGIIRIGGCWGRDWGVCITIMYQGTVTTNDDDDANCPLRGRDERKIENRSIS